MSYTDLQEHVVDVFDLDRSHWDRLVENVAEHAVRIQISKRNHAAETRITKRIEGEPCPGCGKAFENRKRGWLRKFCSDTCRKTHHNRKQKVNPHRPSSCGCCSKPIEQRGDRPRRFCDDKCAREARKRNVRALVDFRSDL